MKTVTALEAKNRFGQLLDAAHREPVTITKNGRPSVVVLSAQDYALGRQRAWKQLIRTLDEVGEHAVTNGLNQDTLDKLLADKS